MYELTYFDEHNVNHFIDCSDNIDKMIEELGNRLSSHFDLRYAYIIRECDNGNIVATGWHEYGDDVHPNRRFLVFAEVDKEVIGPRYFWYERSHKPPCRF